MKNYSLKVKYTLPAFLLAVAGCTALLALLRWVLDIHWHVIELKQEVWELWLPMILPWIPIMLWLRPRYRILFDKKRQEHGPFLFLLLSWLVMVATMATSQHYLTTATGKLETIASVSDIDKKERGRYYHIENFDVAPHLAAVFVHVNTSGKYDEHLDIDVFFAVPLMDKDTALDSGAGWQYWYGIKLKKQLSNRDSDEKKEREYREFLDHCDSTLNAFDYHRLEYFVNTPASDDKTHFLKAIEDGIKQPPPEQCMVLQAKTEPFEKRNGAAFPWIFISLAIGTALFLFLLIWYEYSPEEHEHMRRGEKADDGPGFVLNLLIPRDGHFVTSILAILNIAVFLIMIFSGVHPLYPDTESLQAWGGVSRPDVANGEWWRLFTYMFLHRGAMHLLLNLFGLYLAAMFVEPVLGRIRYLILYLVAGICAGLASIWWHENTVAVGASGAIFGLYGALFALLLTKAFPKEEKKSLFIFLAIYIGINLVWGLVGNVDNAGHLGGLISGAIVGIILFYIGGRKNTTWKEEMSDF